MTLTPVNLVPIFKKRKFYNMGKKCGFNPYKLSHIQSLSLVLKYLEEVLGYIYINLKLFYKEKREIIF